MPMTSEEIAAAPRHPQLMDPVTDPEELILASVWWYPALFPNRTAVLQHLFLSAGNGYEWGADGQLRSVFARIEPDYRTLAEREARFSHGDDLPELKAQERERTAGLQLIRETARDRAVTHGRVMASQGRDLAADQWNLLGRMPENASPAWRALAAEAEQVFAAARKAQDSAATRLRRRWDQDPAGRASRLLVRQLSRAWAGSEISDGELDACEAALAAWSPGVPRASRDEAARQAAASLRDAVRRALAGTGLLEQDASERCPARPGRTPREILYELAVFRLQATASRVRPAPFTAWHEWQWTIRLLDEQFPLAASATPRLEK
jgi:hypothetical protein